MPTQTKVDAKIALIAAMIHTQIEHAERNIREHPELGASESTYIRGLRKALDIVHDVERRVK